MNYRRLYIQLIENARTQNRRKTDSFKYEKHHIIPKCMGGTNESTNLVLLTYREHYIAHLLLHKTYPDNKKLLSAAYMMGCIRSKQNNFYPNSKLYESVRKEHIEGMSGPNNPMYGKPSPNRGIPSKPETIEKLRRIFSGKGNPMYGKTRPDYIRQAISRANKNRVWTEEARRKTGCRGVDNYMYGKHLTQEMKDIRRLSLCKTQLDMYGTNNIDPGLWNSFLLKKSGLNLGKVILYYGTFENMLDLVNKQFKTNFVSVYPDIYSRLVTSIQFNTNSPCKLKEVLFGLEHFSLCLYNLWEELQDPNSSFEEFLQEAIVNITDRLNLSSVTWGGKNSALQYIKTGHNNY